MRDVELNYNQLSKTATANQITQEQSQLLQQRVQGLESDYEQMRTQRNEAQAESTRMQQQATILEKELVQLKTASMKAHGDSSSQSATVQRLQSQLAGKQNDIELLMQQRTQLNEEVQKSKTLVTDAERRYNDLYKQLVQTKENLDILTNEQQILSQELTDKQNQLLKA